MRPVEDATRGGAPEEIARLQSLVLSHAACVGRTYVTAPVFAPEINKTNMSKRRHRDDTDQLRSGLGEV
jgi:hypothetical protein